MFVVFVVTGVVVVFAVAAVAVGRGGGLDPVESDLLRPSLPSGPISADDLDSVRFAVGFRGYRMDQVDDVLNRLGHELTERDARISELERRLAVGGEDGTTS
ncbi:MAG TPA: DivIVA domain-containing protein [Jiangellaceae bacterium]|nr:DivIVA domain-containing protein [Jiangellaceae bacterium]